jgi:hypothetical protein
VYLLGCRNHMRHSDRGVIVGIGEGGFRSLRFCGCGLSKVPGGVKGFASTLAKHGWPIHVWTLAIGATSPQAISSDTFSVKVCIIVCLWRFVISAFKVTAKEASFFKPAVPPLSQYLLGHRQTPERRYCQVYRLL